jgi:hypothetical protein
VASGRTRDGFLTNSIVNMYAKFEMIDEARLMFNRAEKWSEALWNLPSSAYMRMGWPEVVVHVLVWVHWMGLKLDTFDFGGIPKAAQKLESSEYNLLPGIFFFEKGSITLIFALIDTHIFFLYRFKYMIINVHLKHHKACT